MLLGPEERFDEMKQAVSQWCEKRLAELYPAGIPPAIRARYEWELRAASYLEDLRREDENGAPRISFALLFWHRCSRKNLPALSSAPAAGGFFSG